MEKYYKDHCQTPIGKLTFFAQSQQLTHVFFEKEAIPTNLANASQDLAKTKSMKKALGSYFEAKNTQKDIALKLEGTPFQIKVWQGLLAIPYGQTVSYETLAHKIGHPSAVRAVGTACGKNKLPIVVPCHRVIAKSGKLGGFRGGLKAKEILLSLEQA